MPRFRTAFCFCAAVVFCGSAGADPGAPGVSYSLTRVSETVAVVDGKKLPACSRNLAFAAPESWVVKVVDAKHAEVGGETWLLFASAARFQVHKPEETMRKIYMDFKGSSPSRAVLFAIAHRDKKPVCGSVFSYKINP